MKETFIRAEAARDQNVKNLFWRLNNASVTEW